ncbi:MAG: SRPBCC family protein [Acetobacteraceae bacterium]|nr:SRPBCC family protein [Acetobacteraceae bacterium]
MISIREEIMIALPPDRVWPLLCDPAVVATCIPGATLTKTDDDGVYQGTMRVKFGPTVAQFRGEARLAYDHDARRCTISGRGIDSRGASRANASGIVEVSGTDCTLLRVEGTFAVTGPLETFASAGGVHLARAILVDFRDNVARLAAVQTQEAVGVADLPAAPATRETASPAATPAPPAALDGGRLLWRMLLSWLRQVFSGKWKAR